MDKKKFPLITVALATFNGERFLREQIDSILTSNYPNLELIVSDDNSGDSTPSILEEYVRQGKITFIRNGSTLGFLRNFEKIVSIATGQFIAFSDQDDIWDSNKLTKLMEIMSDSKIDMVYSDAGIIDEEGRILGESLRVALNINYVSGDCYPAFYFKNCVSGCTMLFRKSLLDRALPFPTRILYHDWWLAYVAARTGTLAFTDERLIFRRIHSNNCTMVRKKRRSLKRFFYYTKYKLEKIRSSKETELMIFRRLYEFYRFERRLELNTDLIEKLLEFQKDRMRKIQVWKWKGFFRENPDLLKIDIYPEKRVKALLKTHIQIKLKNYFQLGVYYLVIFLVIVLCTVAML